MQNKLRRLVLAATIIVAVGGGFGLVNEANAAPSTLPIVTVESVVKTAIEVDTYPNQNNSVNSIVKFKRSRVSERIDSVELRVPVVLGGTALPVTDYNLSLNLASGIIRFPANVFEVEVQIIPQRDESFERAGETVTFTLLPDANMHSPRYVLGSSNKVLTFISDYPESPVMDFTVNDLQEITINSGESVLLKLQVDLAGVCSIYGGQFMPIRQQLPARSVAAGFWTLELFPTQTTVYNMLCINTTWGMYNTGFDKSVIVNVIE